MDAFPYIDAQSDEIHYDLWILDQQRNVSLPERKQLYCTLFAWERVLRPLTGRPDTHAKEAEGLWRVIDEPIASLLRAPGDMTVQLPQTAMVASGRTDRSNAAVAW